jgi:hypothetical protein
MLTLVLQPSNADAPGSFVLLVCLDLLSFYRINRLWGAAAIA